jgi:hypothetical protein
VRLGIWWIFPEGSFFVVVLCVPLWKNVVWANAGNDVIRAERQTMIVNVGFLAAVRAF